METLAEMTLAQLVAHYNRLTGQNVARFASRQAGLRRIQNFLADKAQEDDVLKLGGGWLGSSVPDTNFTLANEGRQRACPNCGQSEDQTLAGEDGTAAAERLFCHCCSTEYYDDGRIYKAPAKSTSRAAGVAKSWENNAVAAARKVRVSVTVVRPDGVVDYFKSVPMAFKFYGLQWSNMFGVRKTVKSAGEAEFNGYVFTAK